MRRIVVSACLAGVPCRYDGRAKARPELIRLVREGRALPLCPELLAGLGVPRRCCECCGGRIVTEDGEDITEAMRRGAERALFKARQAGSSVAILKQRSPSCGAGQMYDGTFTGKVISGDGLWTALLRRAGFTILTEEDLPLPPSLTD